MLLDGPKSALNQVILTLESSVKSYHSSCFSPKSSVVPRSMVCSSRKVDEKTGNGSDRKDGFFLHCISMIINVLQALQAPACHENLVKVGGYILGEFGNLIAGDPRSR